MVRINIEIPDELHQNLRNESAIKNDPIKIIVIKALQNHVENSEVELDPEDIFPQ